MWARTIITIRATPRQVATGVALGAFIAFTPFIGLQMLLAGLFATLIGASRKAAVLAVWISNPFTIGPIFALTYQIGVWLVAASAASAAVLNPQPTQPLPEVLTTSSGWTMGAVLQAGEGVLVPLLLGGVVLGIVASAVSYVLTHRGIVAYQATSSSRGLGHSG